jgi:NAD/NADP transhydrogenase alpha subunit
VPRITRAQATDVLFSVPADASQAFSRNMLTLVRHLSPEGRLTTDLNEEITGAMALVHGEEVRHRA